MEKFVLKVDPKTRIIKLPQELADYLGGPGTELVIIGMFGNLEVMSRGKYDWESAISCSDEMMDEVVSKLKELGFEV